MKKQTTILAFLFFNCLFASSQKTFIKTTTPCNNDLLKTTPGRWIKTSKAFYAKLSNPQQQEIVNRLEAIHQLMLKIYPSPLGFDAAPVYRSHDEEFSSQLRFDRSPNVGLRDYKINGIATVNYSYYAIFNPYSCGRELNEIMKGYPREQGSTIQVDINGLDGFFASMNLGDMKELMCIDGRPIKLMPVLKGKWKGYDVYYPERGSGMKMVLLHREGMLPFIPATRKQYLDRCLEWLPKYFDGLIKSFDLVPDKTEREKNAGIYKKMKDEVLKHYQDEVDATTKAGLLESPAITSPELASIRTNMPIFTTVDSGGNMLVTENPAYLRKDLPKYIPQFIVLSWYSCHCGADKSLDPFNIIDENFPIEKLQAMIDK